MHFPLKLNNFFKTTLVIVVYTFLFSSFTYSQQTDSDFIFKIKTITSKKPADYQTIDSLFKNNVRDSTKMKLLAKKANTAKNLVTESYAINALAIIYRNVSLYEKALETHKKSKLLADKADNIELQVINLNMIGVVYRRMDVVKPALDFHTQALDLAKSFKNHSAVLKYNIAVSQNSMGNIYLALKQYDLALKQFKKSLAIEKETGNKLGLAINYNNIGFVEEANGNLEKALENYQTSLDYNNEIDSEIGRVICNNSIGEIYIQQGKLNEAKPMIETALEKAILIGDQFYITTSYINLGWVEKEMKNYIDSEKNIKTALKIAEEFGLKSSIVEAKKHLSDLNIKQGKNKTALTIFKDAIALENTITSERNLQYVNDIVIEYENELKNKQIRALADENKIVKSKLERNKKIFWFSMLILGIIGIVLVALYKNSQLQQEKQILTLEQDMLRNQMNPHFIFNSLNSIKLYIINNEKENAVYYLNKFSKLIRKILVASTEKEISLEEELETMQLYMNIENIRFSNDIDFKINIDNDINTSSIKVPTLILQPFLENSLWHGLSSKKEGDKKISLNVYKNSENYITISIEDNGIGRKQSARIKKDKLLKRKSVGINITKARLANFSKRFSNDYKIIIQDLYNDNKASGTKVIVDIPINEIK